MPYQRLFLMWHFFVLLLCLYHSYHHLLSVIVVLLLFLSTLLHDNDKNIKYELRSFKVNIDGTTGNGF